jgi:hypothetical protein
MAMIWIWFAIGMIIAFGGVVLQSSENNINYKGWSFDSEDLGRGLIWLGGATSVVMVICMLIVTGLKMFS